MTRLTGAGIRLGDLRYSSPEQAQGEPVTPAGDVYSLAVSSYEILTGRGPYDAEGPAELVRSHLRADPAAAFLALEGLDAVLPALPLPDWSYRVAVWVGLAGFPVVLVLSWMYDLTSTGIRRTPQESPGPGRTRFRILQWLGVLLSLAVAGLLGWWIGG